MDTAAALRHEKVRRYEDFVDRRLKPDLVDAIAQRDKVFQQQKIFSDLKRNIQALERSGATSLRTMVNLGSEVYMQADVDDTRKVFVDIGLGFYVEFTRAEALEFIPVREARLARYYMKNYCLCKLDPCTRPSQPTWLQSAPLRSGSTPVHSLTSMVH